MRLGRLVLGRYANALLSKCYLSWAGCVAADVARREALTGQALMLISSKHELILASRFAAWRDDVRATRGDRQEKLRRAVLRMRNRLLAASWSAWIELHEAIAAMRRAAAAWHQAAVPRRT